MSDTLEQRIKARVDQALQELEMAPRMEKFMQESLAIHKDSCENCMCREYCRPHDLLGMKLKEWERISYWSHFHKMDKEDSANL